MLITSSRGATMWISSNRDRIDVDRDPATAVPEPQQGLDHLDRRLQHVLVEVQRHRLRLPRMGH